MERQWLIETLSAVQPSQQNYQTQSYTTQPPQQIQPQQARYQQSQQTPAKPAPTPTPAQNSPVVPGANPPPPECNGENVERAESDSKKRHWYKQRGRVSKAEKVSRRNLKLSKILQPKIAAMILNELVKGCQYTIDELPWKIDANQFRASVSFEEQEFAGTGRTKSAAKNSAAETALKYLVKNKRLSFKKEASESGEAGEGANVKMEIGEEDGTQVMPWSQIASFAKYKLFSTWGQEPTTTNRTQELSSPIPKAVGAVQTGRTELKSARKMPDNPEKMNPLMLMDLMLPHAQWDEVGKSGLVSNEVFTFNVTVDGKQFTGTGTNKKSAKNLAAFAACHQILNINYPDDVWTQELSSPIPKAVGAVQTGRTELKSARKMPDNPEKMNPLMLMDLMLPHAQWDEVGKSGLVSNEVFTFNVTVDGKQFTGTGTNKKSAKNLAAFAACHQILNINYPDDVWTQELSSPIPKAVGAVQTGRTELKSARKMPDNPEKMNPLMLMDLMLPHAQWDEVGKSGLVSNEVFTFNVTVDGKQFTGTGTNKKSAKNLAAFAACHQILNINYPDDVWTQELSSPIPKAVGAVQTGRTELKSARKMPDNPEKMNPLMLMDLMLPHAQWDEVGKSGLVSNEVFTFNVTVDGKQFTGTGTNKKSAKNLAAFAACHQILNINYPDDVWTQELSSPIPKAVGAVQTGRTELKSARKMPDNPEKMNPLMLMDLMLPHAQWDEVGKSGLVSNEVFTFNVTVDGKQFTGTGTNKKSAKNLAAFAACHQILNINYPDDVWTQELSSPIPKAVGAVQTGRTELKSARKMPDNPEKMNPLMLMDLMLPHAQWDEVGKSGLVSNEVFTFNVTVDGKQFTGTGTNKKSAKNLAAFAACHQILNINYPDDVWTQELSSPIPKAVGAVQTGRTELKSARKMPDNPEKMNPLMLMDLMLPHAQWDEVGKSGLVSNEVFTFNVTVDGKQFTGTGTNKKSAKNLAAFAACHQILNINYPDDVWTQELSSPIPKAVGAVQTGRTELKSARKMPDNPEKMNPLMLMDLMLPHAQWDEVGKSGLVSNEVFTFNVTVDGKQFTGTGTNKKSAKKLAAFAACHQILNINYPDDVWVPLY